MKSKDLTLDSFWIEEEIKQFLKKEDENNNVNENNSLHQLLEELNKTDKIIDSNLNYDNRPKEVFQKPEEIIVDFEPKVSQLVNKQELPSYGLKAKSASSIIKNYPHGLKAT